MESTHVLKPTMLGTTALQNGNSIMFLVIIIFLRILQRDRSKKIYEKIGIKHCIVMTEAAKYQPAA